jgi:probable DNA repair protein
LRAPYWRTPDFAARCRLDLLLRQRAALTLGAPELRALLGAVAASHAAPAQDLSARLLNATEKLGSGAATPREWSVRLHAALDALGWPGERPRDSAEQQTCERFFDLLKEFGGMAPAWGPVTRDTAIQWLNELAARTPFRPASGDAPITVSPMLADPVVRYDGIWVAGLHAEAWPQPVQSDPFLPLGEQIAAGIPAASAAGRLITARALMRAWSRHADELVLSAPARAEDMELLPSPLLKDYPSDRSDARAALWLPLRMHRDGVLETFADPMGQPWSSDTPLPAGTRSLELQNDCPFRAYAQLRLGAEPAEAPEPGIAADVRGRLLHLALEKLWSQLRNSDELALLSEEACDALIGACVDRAAVEIWRMQPTSPALARERRRTRRLIGALCRLERERAPFEVKHTELESRLKLGEAQLRVRIDRLDVLADRGVVILDYKSGRRTLAEWYGERPSHIQLLAYQAAVGKGVRAMATVNVTAREVRFDGIAAAFNLLPKVASVEPSDAWERQRGEWLMRMERLASQFLTGYAAVDPKPHACDYCHLMSLCRVGEIALDAPEAPADD